MNGTPELSEGFTQLPNELLIAIAKAQINRVMTARESAVITFILRYTYGYKKEITSLKTSFIAKKLGTTPDYISHILKRLENKNIIIRDGNEILFNKHYNDWKQVKLPYHKSELFKGKVVNSINIVNSINKTLQTVSTGIVNSIKVDHEEKQSETERNDCLNKTLLNKTLNKEERNIKERNIFIKNPFLNEKDFKEREKVPAKIFFNNQTFKFENIPKEKLEKWKEAFPLANVEVELKKMEAWLSANPKNKKENYERFIVNWLGRAVPKKDTKTCPELVSGKAERTGFYDATGRRID